MKSGIAAPCHALIASYLMTSSPWPQPILAGKPFDAGKLPLIIGNDRVAERSRLRRNQQVIAADRPTIPLKAGAQAAIDRICRRLERQNLKHSEDRIQLRREPRRASFGRPITQFRRHDDAGAHLGLANRADGLRHLALRVTDKIADHIGIEQIAHQNLTGSSASSAIGGKSSSRGDSVDNTASRDLGGVGSMVSRSPSLRIMASSPGSSNSRGIRTAWLRPFLNSFTCRSELIACSWHMLKHMPIFGYCPRHYFKSHLNT